MEKPNLSQEEIDMLLGKQPKVPQAAPGGAVDQSEIDRMIQAAQKTGNKDNKRGAGQAEKKPSAAGATMSQAEIDALMSDRKPVQKNTAMMDQAEIDAMLAASKQGTKGAAGKETPAPPASTMSQADIDALLASTTASPTTEASKSGMMSQAEIDAMLGAAAPKPPVPAPAPAPAGMMTQAEIDAMLAGAAPKPPAPAPAPAPAGMMTQAEIDAMLASGRPKAAPPAAPAPPAPAPSGMMTQAEIDAMLAGKSPASAPVAKPSPAATPAQPGPGALMIMTQDDIDAMIAERARTPHRTAAPAPQASEPHAHAQGHSHEPHPAKGQRDIDALVSGKGQVAIPESHHPVRRVPQVPNGLGVRTLSPEDFAHNKVRRTHLNPEVTGMRYSRVTTPKQTMVNDTALNAIQRLFSLANAFREIDSEASVDEIARVSNRFGHSAVFAITKNPSKPIRIRLGGIPTFNVYNKFVESQQTYYVDKFTPHKDGLSRKWIEWFVFQFDTPTLESLMQLH